MKTILTGLLWMVFWINSTAQNCPELDGLKRSLNMKDRPFETVDVLQGVQMRFLSCAFNPQSQTVRLDFSFTSINSKDGFGNVSELTAIDMEGNSYDSEQFNVVNRGLNALPLSKGVEQKAYVELSKVPRRVRYFKLVKFNFVVETYVYTVQYKDVRISYPDDPKPTLTQAKQETLNSNSPQPTQPNYKALLDEGSKKFQERAYAEALTKFEKALSLKNGRDTLSALYAGISAQSANNPEKAEAHFTTYINSGGRDVSIFYALATIYTQQRNTDKALGVLKKGLLVHPSNVDLSSLIVNTLIADNRINDVIDHLNTFIAQNPYSTQAYVNLGIFLDGKGDKAGAVSNYEKAIGIDPNQYDALYNLGVYYYNEGANRMQAGQTLSSQRRNFEKAAAYFERAHRVQTYQCELVNNLNKTYELLGTSKRVECYGSPSQQAKPQPQNTASSQNFIGQWQGEMRGAMYYNFNLFITAFDGNQFTGYYTDEEGRIVKRDVRGTVNGTKIQVQLDAIPVEGTISGDVIKGTGTLATPADIQVVLKKKAGQTDSKKADQKPSAFEYRGVLTDKKTRSVPQHVVVFYEDLSTGEMLGQADVNGRTGEFVLYLPYGKRYGISAKGEGFIAASTNIDLTNINTAPKSIPGELAITTIEAGNAITLNNIFFETGKAALLPESFLELNRIADFLKANGSIVTEIAGHTDNVGGDAANQILSQDRANAVRYYLQSRGIQASRLIGKGYGKNKPVAPNTTEAGRQQNRRVEFVILRK